MEFLLVEIHPFMLKNLFFDIMAANLQIPFPVLIIWPMDKLASFLTDDDETLYIALDGQNIIVFTKMTYCTFRQGFRVCAVADACVLECVIGKEIMYLPVLFIFSM
jgi:hypothetical protein